MRLTALPTRSIGRNLRAIVLYGFKVRGDFTQESDLDVLIVANRLRPGSRRSLISNVLDFAAGGDAFPSPMVMSGDEWRFEKDCRSPFYLDIAREGVVLWGTL